MADELDVASPQDATTTDSVLTPTDITARAYDELERKAGGLADDVVPHEAKSEKTAAERARDVQGRFKPVEGQSQKAEPPAAGEQQQAQPEQATQTTHRPPAGWAPAAKVAFDALPPEVKEAVAKREEEIDAGFRKYSGLDQYVRMAESGGTTLPAALEQYVGIENLLRRDPFAAIERVLANIGATTDQFVQAYQARKGGAGPQQPVAGTPQRGPQQPPDVRREVDQVLAERQVSDAIRQFATDPKNRFFDNVRADMGQLIATNPKLTLQDAYDRACWANPEIRAILMRDTAPQANPQARAAAAATQAKAAAKTVVGAPANGRVPVTTPALPKNLPPHKVTEAIFDRLAGGNV